MIDRHLPSDIVLAMVLVLPTAALANAEAPIRPAAASPVMAKAALADHSMNARGVSLLG